MAPKPIDLDTHYRKLLQTSWRDYAGARCGLNNLLMAAWTWSQQVVEKLLKAYILINSSTQAAPTHDLRILSRRAQQLSGGSFDLTSFDVLMGKLGAAWHAKYPDNPAKQVQLHSHELKDVDELVMTLALALPAPQGGEAAGFFAEYVVRPYVTPEMQWVALGNIALVARHQPLVERLGEPAVAKMLKLHVPYVPQGKQEQRFCGIGSAI